MSPRSKCERCGAQSPNLVSKTISWHPLGSNLLAFQPINAPRCLQEDQDPCSVGASAEIIPFSSRRRPRLAQPASRSWSGESMNEEVSRTRNEYNQHMRENILAIGWLGVLTVVVSCILTILMH